MEKKEHKPTDKFSDNKNQKDKDLPYNPDITKEDKQALNEEGYSMDMGQDKALADRENDVDFAAKDLDIPGREERDTSTGTGIPDEDNYQFNQRGTRKDNDKKPKQPDTDRK